MVKPDQRAGKADQQVVTPEGCGREQRLHSLAGLLDESDGDEDPVPQEDDREQNDCLSYGDDDH